MKITTTSASFDTAPFRPLPIVQMTFRRSGCECVVANLPSVLQVVFSGAEILGAVDLEVIATGDNCENVIFSGGPNDEGTSASIVFGDDGWVLSAEGTSVDITLSKIPTGGCDIASPAGGYEGDGYTATVSVIV